MLALNSGVEKLPPNESAKRLGSADIQKPRISPEKRRKSAKMEFALDIQILADATKDTDDGKAQVAAE